MGQRGDSQELSPDPAGDDSVTVPSHPAGVKPAGNAYNATRNLKSATGILVGLPDELLVQVFEYLDARSLQNIGCTCKAMYAFSRLEDIWKTLCTEYAHLSSVFNGWALQALSSTVCTYISCQVVSVLGKCRILLLSQMHTCCGLSSMDSC